jgi:hypothetical protein
MSVVRRGLPGTLHYHVFGLLIRSDLTLPELLPAEASEQPDATIRLGDTGAGRNHEPGVHSIERGLLLVIEGVARYAIRDGSEIVVEPEPDAPEASVRLFLLGSAMGALLHQRGLLPLHANAVEIEGKAFAFMGPSGEGKSTLAAVFHDLGHRIIADDVVVVRFGDDGRAMATAGMPRLRLWRAALAATGRDASHYDRSFAGREQIEKFDVPIARELAGSEPELAAVYLLAAGEQLKIERLGGTAALQAVTENTYRGGFVGRVGKSRDHWEECLKLVRRVPVFLLTRTKRLDQLHDEATAMLAHARELTGNAPAPAPGVD